MASTAASTAASLPTPAADTVDLDDDDPVLAFQRRRRRLTLAAIAGSAVVVGAIAVGVIVDRSQRLPGEVVAGAQQALALGDEQSRTRALAAIEATTAPGRTALRARRLAEEARALRDALRLAEEARTVNASMVPPGTVPPTTLPGVAADAATRAEARLAEAGAAILQSRAEDKGGVDAALAASTAALAAFDLDAVAREAGLARELSRTLSDDARAVVDDELRLLVSLAEAARVAAKDQESAAAVREKLLRFGDARARAAAAIAGLVPVRIARDAALAAAATPTATITPPSPTPTAAVAVDGTVVATARAAFSTLPADDPRREAGEALLTALTTLPPPPEPVVDPNAPVEPGTAPGMATSDIPADEPFDALMVRGEKALVAGRGQAAYDAFKRATTKNPASGKAWLKCGWAALDIGRKSEAPRLFQRALAASPSLAEAQFGLAEALRFSGRTTEAVVAYKQYLEMDPTGRDAGIAKKAIKQLEE
jgi:tetratricopeptide (TPR) repeat protein